MASWAEIGVFEIAKNLELCGETKALAAIKLYLSGDTNIFGSRIGMTESDQKPSNGTSYLKMGDKFYYRTRFGFMRARLISEMIKVNGLLIPKEKYVCPDCGSSVRIFPINIKCKKTNPREWTARMECTGVVCTWHEYTTDSMDSIVFKMEVVPKWPRGSEFEEMKREIAIQQIERSNLPATEEAILRMLDRLGLNELKEEHVLGDRY